MSITTHDVHGSVMRVQDHGTHKSILFSGTMGATQLGPSWWSKWSGGARRVEVDSWEVAVRSMVSSKSSDPVYIERCVSAILEVT